MLEVVLLPFLVFSDVLLIRSLEEYEYRNILIALVIIAVLLMMCWLTREDHEVLSIWLFSLYIIPHHFINEVINSIMGHSADDENAVRRILKFLRVRVFYALLIIYQVLLTIIYTLLS